MQSIKELLSEKSSASSTIDDDDMLLLWIFRLMVPLGGHKTQLREKDFRDDQLAEAMRFGRYLTGETYDLAEIRKEMVTRWEAAEEMKSGFRHKNAELRSNVDALCSMLGLSHAEADILHFSAMTKASSLLDAAVCMHGPQTAHSLERLFSVCLDLSSPEVRKALLPVGTLSMSGLLRLDTTGIYDFSGKVELLNGLVDELHACYDDPSHVLRNIIHPSPKAKLSDLHYPHLAHEVSLVGEYIGNAISSKSKGANVLVHGIPGSGKSEFVRMLAEKYGIELYEVASGTRLNAPLDADGRFRAYRLGQTLCERKSCAAAILFDEVEDVFCCPRNEDSDSGNRSGRKGWINHALEENPVPAFWITNNIDSMDAAYLRRFDFVLEINAPPRSVREKILTEYLADLPVSGNWKKQMAEHEALVPAVVERAAKVVKTMPQPLTISAAEQALEQIIGNTVEAMGYRRPSCQKSLSVTRYRLEVLNTDQDITALCAGLKRHKQGRICLYGPPGTGKTALGKHIADLLDMPLLARRASDIIAPYVGMTERNMASMFRQAQDDRAVLLLDEADSFLQDRRGAQHSWELTQVNELLTQMENFQGVFICATNFMEHLDQAAMRRFTFKVKFGYLTQEQSESLFLDTLQRLESAVPDSFMLHRLRQKLAKLPNLTPGDFAATADQFTLLGKQPTPDELIAELRQASAIKDGGRALQMGFAA